MRGHTYDECRYRLNAAAIANNAANNNMLVCDRNANSGSGAGQMWCKYCKKGGHLIEACRKRMYNEQRRANNVNVVASGQQGSSNQGKRCYNCNEYAGHIAKDCPKSRNFQ